MATIIRGTTPTIKYTFQTVSPADITIAVLSAKQGRQMVLEKTLTAATVGEADISWTLSQQETLGFGSGTILFQCNWKTSAGIRGASKELAVRIEDNQKAEVI